MPLRELVFHPLGRVGQVLVVSYPAEKLEAGHSPREGETMRKAALIAAAATLAIAGSAFAFQVPESEPNDTKAQATPVPLTIPGPALLGNSTSATGVGLDYFQVIMPNQPLAIYRNQMVLTSNTAGHTATIREVGQAGVGDTLPGIPWDGVVGAKNTTETVVQTAQTVGATRVTQWYSFGYQTSFTYRVTGAAATTADYLGTWSQSVITPVNLGTFQPGLITMNWNGQGHTTDTDMQVYDSNLVAISGYGNDDSSATLGGAPIATTALQSWLARNYAPGVYYIALSNFQLAPSVTLPSDDNFRSGSVFENDHLVANSSTVTSLWVSFTISDGTTTLPVSALKTEAFEVLWFRFEVVPEPTSLGLCLLALPLALRRRRA